MSQRPTFTDGVECRSVDLNYETSNRSAETLQRTTDLGSGGVVSGLQVSINSGTTYRIDIASGRGYTPSGELIVVPATIPLVNLADYTLNTVNLITLVYTELGAVPRSHETAGTAPNTQAQRSYRVTPYTQAQYNALPATNADLTLDAQDRALVLASIPGQGFAGGGSTPNPLLASTLTTSTNVLNLSSPYSAVFTTPPAACTGVELVSLTGIGNSAPPLGAGTLFLVTSSNPPTLAWQAPGDGGTGLAVSITSATTWVLSSGGGSTITVFASPELFPASGSYSDSVTVSQLTIYNAPTTPDLSSADRRHRRTKGGLVQTANNAHGVRGSDISKVLRVEQGAVLGTNLPSDAAHAIMPRISAVSVGGGTARNLMQQWAGSSSPSRVYRVYSNTGTGATFGTDAILRTINARWDGTNWNKDVSGVTASLLVNDVEAGLLGVAQTTHYSRPAGSGGTWTDANWVQGWMANSRTVSTTRTLQVDANSNSPSSTSAVTLPAIYETSSSATSQRWLIFQNNDAAFGVSIRRYVYWNSNNSGIEETYNALWDGTFWNREIAGFTFKRRISSNSEEVLFHDASASAAAWTDTVGVGGWDRRSILWSVAGGTSQLFDGFIGFGSGGLSAVTNPAMTTAATNALMALNAPKAWGKFTMQSGGNPTQDEGFNFAGVTATAGGANLITVTMASSMANSSYAVVCTMGDLPFLGSLWSISQAMQVVVGTRTTNTFHLQLVNYNSFSGGSTLTLDPQGATNSGISINFMVFGRQS